MKKFYSSQKALLGLVALFGLAVASCVKFAAVTFDKHELAPGEKLTVTAVLQGTGSQSGVNLYDLLAVRVPADWSVADLPTIVYDKEQDGSFVTTDGYGTQECEAYATVLNEYYPKDGYKWIGFSTKQQEDIRLNDASKITTVFALTAGNLNGDFRLDFACGTFKFDPSLLAKNGKTDVTVAFGRDCDGNVVTTTGRDKVEVDGQTIPVFTCSEYIMLGTTMGAEELDHAKTAFLNEPVTIEGTTMPVWPKFSESTPDYDLSVKVSGQGGIDGVAADAAEGAAEYFDFQGRKVANPNSGIYLVRRGNKVSKEVIR